MIPILSPLFTGPLTAYGEMLTCDDVPATTAVRIVDLIDNAEFFCETLRKYASHIGAEDADVRAIASSWSLIYLDALMPAVAAAASVLEHCFPVAAADMAVELAEDGTPRRFYLGNSGYALPGSETSARYRALLDQHLSPLFAAVNRVTRLPKKILWGNAERELRFILDEALRLAGPALHIQDDRKHLLLNRTWPDGRRNPMFKEKRLCSRVHDGETETIELHGQCCLAYLLPNEGYCDACPLAPEYRALNASEANTVAG